MLNFRFTKRVLGKIASQRLREKEVTQTVRSNFSTLPIAYLEGAIKSDEEMEIILDGDVIGQAHLKKITPVSWSNLDINDARRGGFNNRFELAYALRRAGYRFMPPEEYNLMRIRFDWS